MSVNMPAAYRYNTNAPAQSYNPIQMNPQSNQPITMNQYNNGYGTNYNSGNQSLNLNYTFSPSVPQTQTVAPTVSPDINYDFKRTQSIYDSFNPRNDIDWTNNGTINNRPSPIIQRYPVYIPRPVPAQAPTQSNNSMNQMMPLLMMMLLMD